MNKYDLMARKAEELLDLAEQSEDADERESLKMEAANLWYDIENDERLEDTLIHEVEISPEKEHEIHIYDLDDLPF